MKKILFVTVNKISSSDGPSKKILAQVKALRNLGHKVDFVHMTSSGDIRLVGYDGQESIMILGRCLKYFFFIFLKRYLDRNDFFYDVLYLRNPRGGFFSLFLSSFVRCERINYKILEIPTYPYESEVSSAKVYISDLIYRFSRFSFINRFDLITFMGTPVSSIWGVSAKRINNGVDLQSVVINGRKPHFCNKELKFIAVARLEEWHGYDRLIRGLYNYLGNENGPKVNIHFDIVGSGDICSHRLKLLVKQLKLDSAITFHGELQGARLDELFSQSDIAVDALGRHRTGNNYNSSLKSKEYTARGLPFIKSHIDEVFDCCDFVFNCFPDDSDIDIDNVIAWFFSIDNRAERIRDFAKRNFTWEHQMDFINKI